MRWNADSGSAPTDPWARLIDENIVLHRWKKQVYVGWDVQVREMKYKIDQESFFASLPALSGRHRYLCLFGRICGWVIGGSVDSEPFSRGFLNLGHCNGFERHFFCSSHALKTYQPVVFDTQFARRPLRVYSVER